MYLIIKYNFTIICVLVGVFWLTLTCIVMYILFYIFYRFIQFILERECMQAGARGENPQADTPQSIESSVGLDPRVLRSPLESKSIVQCLTD